MSPATPPRGFTPPRGVPATLPPRLEWAVATLALPGQSESGDLHVVKQTPTGMLIGVVDGLGHGEEAAVAARQAVVAMDRAAGEPLMALVRRCHEALRRTRGVVMSVAWLNGRDDTMSWLGVGNVEGVLVRAQAAQSETIMHLGGVVGYDLPALRPATHRLSSGDLLIFATDGIRAGFTERLSLGGPPQRLADHILANYSRGNDDALVLVARYLGQGP